MPKTPRPRRVREPVQVYLAPDDRDLLDRLAEESGLSRAEILRRGIRSYAAAQAGPSPMLQFVAEGADGRWPADVAGRHDEILADTYRPPPGRAGGEAGRRAAQPKSRKPR